MNSWILGLHLLSFHFPAGHWETVTPGIYVRTPSGITAGAYRNSEGRMSVYAGQTLRIGAVDLLVGGVTGYHRLTPMVVPSVAFGPLRIAAAPKVGNGAAFVHLAMEYRF